uniref:Uncharacterized protein n=1 Tax=Anguilla anguilla TaxID=7936 RepID=A0A0E9SB53_ANGAN
MSIQSCSLCEMPYLQTDLTFLIIYEVLSTH